MPNVVNQFGKTAEQRYVPSGSSAMVTTAQACILSIPGANRKEVYHIEVGNFIADTARFSEKIIGRVVVCSFGDAIDPTVFYEPVFSPSATLIPDLLQQTTILFDTLYNEQGKQSFDFATPLIVKEGDTLNVIATPVYAQSTFGAGAGPQFIQAELQRLSVYGREISPYDVTADVLKKGHWR